MKLVEMRKDIETFLTKLEKQEMIQIDYFTFMGMRCPTFSEGRFML